MKTRAEIEAEVEILKAIEYSPDRQPDDQAQAAAASQALLWALGDYPDKASSFLEEEA